MYRIHFEPKGGYFCIQVLFFCVVWRNVKRLSTDNKKMEAVKFQNLESARKEVEAIGLDVLYEDRSVDKYRRHIQGL